MENNHFVYMLQCKDDTLYTGYTVDLAKRVKMHEIGKGAKYTRGRGPFEIVYVEQHATKTEALRREYAIKQLQKQEKISLIQAYKGKMKDEYTKQL